MVKDGLKQKLRQFLVPLKAQYPHIQKPTIGLTASADEAMVDSWASELSQALSSIGPSNVLRQRLIVELQFLANKLFDLIKLLPGLIWIVVNWKGRY